MANRLTGSVLLIDTTVGAEVTGRFRLSKFVWAHNEHHAIVAGNDLAITNGADEVILEVRATGATTYTFPFPGGLRMDGLKVSELDGGELYIYLYPSER